VAELLKFKMRYGWPHVLVRSQWTGRDASGDTWEPLENLADCQCEEVIAAIWKVASWYIPLLDGIYHEAIGIYHMVYAI
jgi:hypothetical protein